jgi:hypothetical protein
MRPTPYTERFQQRTAVIRWQMEDLATDNMQERGSAEKPLPQAEIGSAQ